jgi:quercetin dioxygenase-like cupin family protein
MNEIIEELAARVPNKEQINRLQQEVSKLPQVEDMVTDHFFADGMYSRRVFRKAGTLIIGKVHKKDHFFICTKGEIIAWTEKGMKKLVAGDIIECKQGTKRVTLATMDSIGTTVHRTNKTNLDEIEEELIEVDETALFDSSNKLKSIVIECQKMALEG